MRRSSKIMLISCVVAIAVTSQCDVVKKIWGTVDESLTAVTGIVSIYENMEPKEQWNEEKCNHAMLVLKNYCQGICKGEKEDCMTECKTDFEESYSACVQKGED